MGHTPLRRLPDLPIERQRKARAARLAEVNAVLLDYLERAGKLATSDGDRQGYEVMRAALLRVTQAGTAPNDEARS